MSKLLEYNATLAERQDLTPALAIFRAAFDEAGVLPGPGAWFVPGQYLVIGLNNPDVALGGVQRPMSIASSAHERRHVEFYVRFVDKPSSENPFTHLLWATRPGGRLYMRPKARGKFTVVDTIGESDSRLKVFVSAGTGLAPFVSIVRSRLGSDPHASLADCAILHGASYPEDLGYLEELMRLAASHGLRYLPTVSRPPGDWYGATGRVEDLFLPERLADTEQRLGLDGGALQPERAVVYVCGLQGTIGRSIERLAVRGFIPDHGKIRRALEVPEERAASLYFEQYDTEPVIDLDDATLMDRLRRELAAASSAT